MLQNADEARAAVASVRYPPDGIRGVMSLQRMNMYGAQNPSYYKASSPYSGCARRL